MPSDAALILAHPSRTIAHVLLDIEQVERALRIAERRWYQTRDDEDADAAAMLDDRRFALKDEAKALIERATGVTWAQIEGASL